MRSIFRLGYIAYRIISDLVGLASRAANAIIFNGSTAQTLSARAYLDGRDSRFWAGMGRIINALFFWQDNHIKTDWENEVARARYTLQRLEGMTPRKPEV